MPITYIGGDSDGNQTQTPAVALSFSGIPYQADDFALIFAIADATSTVSGDITINTATGWAELDNYYHTGGNRRCTAVHYKKLTPSETDPGLTYAGSPTEQLSGLLLVFRGVDTIDPWGSSSPFFQRDAGTITTNPTNPAITTDADNSSIILFKGQTNTSNIADTGEPTGYTAGPQILLPDNKANATAAYLLDSGSAGIKTPTAWTHADVLDLESYTVYTIALKPADDTPPQSIDLGAIIEINKNRLVA